MLFGIMRTETGRLLNFATRLIDANGGREERPELELRYDFTELHGTVWLVNDREAAVQALRDARRSDGSTSDLPRGGPSFLEAEHEVVELQVARASQA